MTIAGFFFRKHGLHKAFLRPDSDDTVDGWTTTPLYEQINETSYNDGDYIDRTRSAGQSSTCKITLSNPNFTPVPYASGGRATIRLRWAITIDSGDAADFKVELYEGASLRATPWSGSEPFQNGGFIPTSYNLTQGEYDSITDWDNLLIWVTIDADGGNSYDLDAYISWFELELTG